MPECIKVESPITATVFPSLSCPSALLKKIGLVNPLPRQLFLDFAARVDKLAIVEELDPIIENHCRQLGLEVTGKDLFPMEGEYSQNLSPISTRLTSAVSP